jgi:hypothetical protein
MTLLRRPGLAALACLIAAGCGPSPTAPSAMAAPTDPVAAAPPVFPAPVSQTLTGTWFLDGRNFMTLTQDGSSVTGMEVPSTISSGGVTSTGRAMITGSVSGSNVTLQLSSAFVVSSGIQRMSCTAGDTFTGTIDGNTLSGIYAARTTPIACSAEPPIALATIEGPTTFTRQ